MPITGGCLCGQVRYALAAEPLGQAVCHCRNCQRQGGSAFSVLLVARADAFALEGQPARYADTGDSGGAVDRWFCPACGSPIYSALPASPGQVFIKAGTLDDPSILAPRVHVWCDSAWPWTAIPDGAVRIPKNAT